MDRPPRPDDDLSPGEWAALVVALVAAWLAIGHRIGHLWT